VTHTLRDY